MTLLYSITMYYWPSLSPSISLSLSILQLHEPTLPFRNLMSTTDYVVSLQCSYGCFSQVTLAPTKREQRKFIST